MRVIDDRCKSRTAQRAHIGNGKCPAYHILDVRKSASGSLGQFVEFLGYVGDALAVNLPDNGDQKPPVRIHRHPTVIVVFQNNLLGIHVESGIKLGMGLQAGHDSFQRKNGER